MKDVNDYIVTPEEEQPIDFFSHEPTKTEKLEMRKACKPPSEWLKLLCKEWANENEAIVEATDTKFIQYKSYLRGQLSSQLLCRLSIQDGPKDCTGLDTVHGPAVDFWGILGIEDDFDKSYITAQIERFCSLYSIRGGPLDDVDGLFDGGLTSVDAATAAAAAAAGITVSTSGGLVNLPAYLNSPESAAAAAAAVAVGDVTVPGMKKKQSAEKAHRMAKDAEKALENERRQNMKREQRRLTMERKELKAREREVSAVRKASERAARDATREERRRKKLEIRMQREKFTQEQKEAALRRAAELVASNRVPIEITRGAAAATAAANAAVAASGAVLQPPGGPQKKSRSCIVVSTASDLQQIVTHAKNLWTKYNAIAKEHNQKVNWNTVAKELGIHVKVREKYARMFSRAEQRGFDWEKCGHYKIKDHPHIFLEPTQAEQKAKMPPPPPDTSRTVLISDNKEAVEQHSQIPDVEMKVDEVLTSVPGADDQAVADAAAAAAASVATLVADPTATMMADAAGVALTEEAQKITQI